MKRMMNDEGNPVTVMGLPVYVSHDVDPRTVQLIALHESDCPRVRNLTDGVPCFCESIRCSADVQKEIHGT